MPSTGNPPINTGDPNNPNPNPQPQPQPCAIEPVQTEVVSIEEVPAEPTDEPAE